MTAPTNETTALATTVFKIEMNVSTDDYKITVFEPISNGTTIENINFEGAKAGNNDFVGVGSNDTTNKLDFLLSGSDSVNTNDFSVGVGSGQRIDGTETARFDFVTNLTDDMANPTVTFAYDEIFLVTSFKQTIAVVNPLGDGRTSFTMVALLTDGDLDLFGDATGETPIIITGVKIFNLLGEDITTDIEFTDFGSISGVGTTSVTIIGMEEGWEYEITTDTGFSAVEISAIGDNAFKLGIFTVTTTSDEEPIDFVAPIDASDADDDTVTSEITVTFLPEGSVLGDDTGETIPGTAEDDIIAGLAGNDTLSGLAGDDQLFGGAGDDILDGGADNDFLTGDSGSDTLTGGTGADVFIYAEGDGGATVALADLITDFVDGTDVIGLRDGLTFADLTIDQSADVVGDVTFDTVISVTATSEILTVLDGIDGGVTIDTNDFIIV